MKTAETDTTVHTLPQSIAAEKTKGTTPIFQDRFVRPAEQVVITGRSLASIFRDQRMGTYPPAIRIGDNATAVRLSSLMAWMDSREVITPENTKPICIGRKSVGRPKKASTTAEA